ncbi:MAG TPA: rhodoquinone biosynthesis methyltransferase RquA [Accumulibacter sp.]|nr:rhodoquinone biosynthesis methyltransferase RquA [Accumulibacter sp.]HMW17554.1 rhodoquinone biosynthesis methyltransferase RquA [Accumulibacter sp.]HMX23110.1 rhodoquinone biosynthesis methyltransferase RquA [Accumulibacter sp.]HMY06008.1 rhodoquinone biosynthesis methyltransferase RquA [Accumulibacter sp.]HNC17632.1 rhodoquinone biosynthesis methyltransferase RquA [Accumulibacter sp.]
MKNSYDSPVAACAVVSKSKPEIPHYLQAHYWWAYVHPQAVQVFERQWLVNLILWGNYKRLCNALLADYGHQLPGRTLQIACAYGDLTARLVGCVSPDGLLEVIDILPIQLENLASKLPPGAPIKLHCMDSAALTFDDRSFDRALLFFLLHEQPQAVREKTLAEALRVIRPGGTLTIVDYAPPSRFNPLRYLWKPLLDRLEPFANDLFNEEILAWLPKTGSFEIIDKKKFFGGMYQMLTLRVAETKHLRHAEQ